MKRYIAISLIAIAGLFVMFSSAPAQSDAESALRARLHERRVAYRDTLLKVVEVLHERYRQGSDVIDALLEAQIALIDADLAITSDPSERIDKLQKHLDALRQAEAYQDERIKIGAGRIEELYKTTATRMRGEIMLLEEQLRQEQ